jgi:peptidoglycan/xylan/chitin deacetylase (PgdA/CDA1 family)
MMLYVSTAGLPLRLSRRTTVVFAFSLSIPQSNAFRRRSQLLVVTVHQVELSLTTLPPCGVGLSDFLISAVSQLEKHGKGIILMHDFKHHTAEALPELLRQFKAGGYKSCTWCRRAS